MRELEHGVNTAMKKREIEIAKNQKRMGLPVVQIAGGTGLYIDTIESLQ
jgi:hypothetical protein